MIGLAAVLAQEMARLPGTRPVLPQDHPTTTVPDTLPEPPLPGGLAGVIRWFFHVPQWIQIGGAVLAVFVGGWLAFWLWSRRADIVQWLRTRRLGIKIAMLVVAALFVIGAASFAKVSWDYTQHSNAFCTACHVMGEAFRKFERSEHADLECHDCHQQPISASLRQVYLWVLERPEEIGPHSPVPNERCATCHIQQDPDSTWQRIAATAGHRVHLESDSAALDTAMCVTCHGVEVHRFVPAEQTCGQADCHAEEDTRIVLGTMAGQTGLHCVGCHQFTAPVPEKAPRDTAYHALTPGEAQCLGCHEMQQMLADFQVSEDPHDGACGWCHDPHRQERPDAAFTTCTGSGCHARADTLTPFHRGLAHAVVDDCGACHRAHGWTVEGEDCASCHTDIPGARRAGSGSVPVDAPAGDPPPDVFRGASPGPAGLAGGPRAGGDERRAAAAPGGWATFVHDRSGSGAGRLPYQQAYDRPFDHADHTDVECTACHATGERHGQVTVTTARECASCHHGAEAGRRDCVSCHSGGALAGATPVEQAMSLAVWEAPRTRSLPFDHRSHEELVCGECHRDRPLLSADRGCVDCHEEHHQGEATCWSCHATPPDGAHDVAVHETSCTGSGCHGAAAEATLAAHRERTRSLCLSCHTDQLDHEQGARCADCHLLPPVHSERAGLP